MGFELVTLSRKRTCEQKLPYTLVCDIPFIITLSGYVGTTLVPEQGNLAGVARKTFKRPEAVNIGFSAKISSACFLGVRLSGPTLTRATQGFTLSSSSAKNSSAAW